MVPRPAVGALADAGEVAWLEAPGADGAVQGGADLAQVQAGLLGRFGEFLTGVHLVEDARADEGAKVEGGVVQRLVPAAFAGAADAFHFAG